MSKKFSQLPAAVSLAGSDLVPIVQPNVGGTTKTATVAQLAALAAVVPVVNTFASRPGSPAAGQLFYPTDGGFAQVYDGTNWYNIVGGIPLRQPPSQATLSTQWNFGTSSLVDSKGQIIFAPQVGAGPLLRGAGKAISNLPTASVTIASVTNCFASFAGCGCYMRETSTGKILKISLLSKVTGTLLSFGVSWDTWTNATTRNGSPTPVGITFQEGLLGFLPPILRMRVSGANIISEVSVDGGVTFTTVATIAVTSAFTTAPDEFGICAYVDQGTSQATHSVSSLVFTG